MSPKKLLLSHPLVWERNRHWRAPYRGGTKTKEEHQGLYEQRRGKEFTFAGAKNYIPTISPRLWTWGNCGLWEQVQAGVRPNTRLSGTYTAHYSYPETFLEILEDFGVSLWVFWTVEYCFH